MSALVMLVMFSIACLSFAVGALVGVFFGYILGYALLQWAIKQEGYQIRYSKDKPFGDGRYTIYKSGAEK